MGIFDVEPAVLIKEMAKDFRQKFKQPQWTEWVKTGPHTERAPQSKDWFFERTASVLYRVYKDGPVGTESLRTYYGGRKKRGVRPEKKRKSGGKIIRTCLQALEKEGFIKKVKTGRAVTSKGESYLNKLAKDAKAMHEKETKEKAEQKSQKEADELTKQAQLEAAKQSEKKEGFREQKKPQQQKQK